MSTQTSELAYIPISLKPRLIASGKGLLAFALLVHQAWYIVLSEYTFWMTSFKDPINDSLNVLLQAGLVGILIGYAVIALRSAATGYAPTKGTITFRSFGAHYPNGRSGHVDITEDSPMTPVALVNDQGLEEDCIDGAYKEESTPTDGSHTESASPREKTHETPQMGDLLVKEALHEDDHEEQQPGTTRALIVYPVVYSEEKVAPAAQALHEITEIRRLLYFLVSFFKELTVSVVLAIGSIIRQCQVKLDNRLKSFVGFLAVHVKGTRLEWENFEGRVFHSVVEGSLPQAKHDLKKKMNEAIKELDPMHPTVEVLELRSIKKRPTYYNTLSNDWHSELQAELLAYHSLVKDIQTDPTHTPNFPLERWRQLYQRLIPAYDTGFVAENLENDEDNRWSWARAPYLYIRDGQLIFIFFCAELERKAGQQTDDPRIQSECRAQEAWLWREAVFTAMTYQPDLKRGEYALRRYLEVCLLLGWQEAAQRVADQYCQRMARLAPKAKLHSASLALIAKVTALLQKDDEDVE